MSYIEIEQSTVDEMAKEIEELEAYNKELKTMVRSLKAARHIFHSEEELDDLYNEATKLLEK